VKYVGCDAPLFGFRTLIWPFSASLWGRVRHGGHKFINLTETRKVPIQFPLVPLSISRWLTIPKMDKAAEAGYNVSTNYPVPQEVITTTTTYQVPATTTTYQVPTTTSYQVPTTTTYQVPTTTTYQSAPVTTTTTYQVPTTSTYHVPTTTSYTSYATPPPVAPGYAASTGASELVAGKGKLTGDTTAPSGYMIPPSNVAPYHSNSLGVVATGDTTYQAPGYLGSASAGGYAGDRPPDDPSQSAPPPVYQSYYDQTKLDRSPAIYSTSSNAPIQYQMADKWVIVNTTEPLRMFCPYDNDWTTTHIERAPGGGAMCACLFLWCFCWPCMLLPCLMP
jgi:hypothetical protein